MIFIHTHRYFSCPVKTTFKVWCLFRYLVLGITYLFEQVPAGEPPARAAAAKKKQAEEEDPDMAELAAWAS
jgi:hypothetical protein